MTTSQISLTITADPSGVERGIGRAKRSLADFKSSGEQSLGGVGQAASLLQGKLAAIGGGLSVGLAVGQLVQVQREFDALNSSLVTVAGGSAAAAKEMDWLKVFAKETPFGLAQATSGFVKMKALGLDPTRASLTSFGNTAAAMGKDLNQMIEAVADASTGEFERLKEFGIKAKKEGDQVKLTFQGVTTSIGNNAYEITKYLEGIGNVQFAGAMEERAKTLDGAIASLGDTWDELFRTISSQGVGDAITESVRAAEASISDLTTIIRSLDGATAGSANQTQLLAGAQEVLAMAFEAISVLGVNVKYTLVQIGNELGGLAAQAVAVATGQFAQAAEISRLMRADAEKARKEVDATSERILNARRVAALSAPNNYDTETSVLRARAAADKAAADAKAAAAKASRDAEAAEAARAAAAKEAAKEAKKAAEAELEWRRKSRLDMVKAWDEEAEAARKAYDAARAGALKLAEATEAAQANTTAGLVEKLAAMRAEIDMLGLTAEAQAELTVVKAEQVIADKEIELIMLRNADASAVQIQLLEQEINLRKQLVAAMRQKAGKEAATDAAKDAAAAWQRASDDIERSLTDALMRGFESGKDFVQNLRDTAVNLFKTLVFRPVISAVVSPVAGAITNTVTGGMGSMGSSMLGNAASNYATSAIGAGLWGSSAAYGAALGTTSIGAGSQAAMLAAQTGVFGSAGASATAAAAGNAGMSSILAAAPWLLGGLAVLALLKSLDKGKTYHTGGLGSYSAAGGSAVGTAVQAQGLDFGLNPRDFRAQSESAAVDMARAVVGLLDSTASTFGKEAGYYAATAFADDSSKSGAWGALMLRLGDRVLLDWGQGVDKWPGREFANGEAGAREYAAAVAKDVRDYLLTQTPDWADAMLNALGNAPTLENLSAVVAQINQAAAALDGMGRASQAFAGLSEAATAALIKAIGGAEAATASLSTYYSNFYSEEERTALATARLTEQLAALGLALPTTREAFRGMVDAALAAGNTGLAANLLNLSGAFASITAAAPAAAEAARQTAAASTQALRAAIDREKQQWQAAADAAATLRDEVQGIFATLADGISGLRADALGTEGSAAQAQQFISQSIAAALATGVLPDVDRISGAIGAAREGISTGQFASDADRSYAALVLAGQLETLQAVAGDQLTEAERQYRAAQTQIEQLDKTLAYWEQQVGLAQGNIDATLTVAEAITALQEAMKPGSTGKGKDPASTRNPIFAGTPGYSQADYRTSLDGVPDYARGSYVQVGGRYISVDSQSTTSLEDYFAARLTQAYRSPEADMRSTFEQLTQSNFAGSADKLFALALAAGIDPNIIASYRQEFVVPKFAAGGYHAGGWALVGEQGPELAYMPPAHIYTAPQTNAMLGGNTARLESLVQGLTAEVQRLQAVVAEGNSHAASTAQTLAAVTNGNALVTEPVPNF